MALTSVQSGPQRCHLSDADLGVGIVGSGCMARTYAECISRSNGGARLVPIGGGSRAPTLAAEQISSWPGMGQVALASITQRDLPVLAGSIFVVAVLVLVSSLIADLAYAVVDPRIRLQ